MKRLKMAVCLLLAAVMILSVTACGKDDDLHLITSQEETSSIEKEVKTKVAALFGPIGLGLAKMKEDRAYGYDVTYYDSPEKISSLIENGEADIATVPLETAASLWNKNGGKIKVLAVVSLGYLQVVENGDSIESISDLKGKTVYSCGEGTAAECIFDYILSENDLDPEKDVKVEYVASASELETMIKEGNAEVCILPQPDAAKTASENEKYRIALDLEDEIEKISDSGLAMGCIIARSDYIEANPDIISEFITFAEVSSNFANLFEIGSNTLYSLGYFETRELAAATVPGCHLVFIYGEDMNKICDKTMKILNEANPDVIGNAVPGPDFYFAE